MSTVGSVGPLYLDLVIEFRLLGLGEDKHPNGINLVACSLFLSTLKARSNLHFIVATMG